MAICELLILTPRKFDWKLIKFLHVITDSKYVALSGVEESTEEVESVEETVAEEVTDVVEETAPVVDEAGDEG